ncbi:uncharacterized protein LOC115970250 [Quercus lobata]|uniref:uncharacterized protein LOC115970250 n=1 Tax=Quercus lobata TaxID=97700 RepID=UPI001245CE6F|nr:uncharacterized protein LOC115970250 [Quercus lobata]
MDADGNLFIYNHDSHLVCLLLYVDDIIVTGNHAAFLTSLLVVLGTDFDLKDLGRLHYFLGLQIDYTPSGLFVHQTKYTLDLLNKFSMSGCKPCKTPCSPNAHLLANDSPLLHDPTFYRSLVGALQYLTFTRPDISFAVQQACQFMSSPTSNHLQAAKRILRYLQGSIHQGLAFTPGPLTLSAYSDADWAGDPMDKKSISGILVFLGHSPITWSAKKQSTVSRSSTEAEYRALASCAAELCWIRMLLKDFGVFLSDPPVLWCDNVSALAIASNPVFHARTKHIEVDFHFVRERVLRHDLLVKFVASQDQLADILTKGLASPRFQWLTSKLMWKFPMSLRGDEEHKVAEDEAISGDEDEEPLDAIKLAKGKMKTVS